MAVEGSRLLPLAQVLIWIRWVEITMWTKRSHIGFFYLYIHNLSRPIQQLFDFCGQRVCNASGLRLFSRMWHVAVSAGNLAHKFLNEIWVAQCGWVAVRVIQGPTSQDAREFAVQTFAAFACSSANLRRQSVHAN